MKQMAEINTLLKKAVKHAYKKAKKIYKIASHEGPLPSKIIRNTDKEVKYVDNSKKGTKDTGKTLKGKHVKMVARKTPDPTLTQ